MPGEHITFKTDLDNEKLVKGLSKAKKDIERLQKKINTSAEKRLPLAEQVEDLNTQLNAAKKRLQDLQAESQRLSAVRDNYNINNPSEIQASIEAAAKLPDVDKTIVKASKEADVLQVKLDKAAKKLERADTAAAKLNGDLAGAKVRAVELERRMAKAQSVQPLTNALNRAESRTTKFCKKITTMFHKVFMFSALLAAFRSVKNWMWKIIKTNNEATAALGRLKGALLTLAQPIVEVTVPAFVDLCNILERIVVVAANAISILFGKSVQDSARNAKALDKESKAISGVGKAAKNAASSLASFDEINRLSNNDNNDPGASSSGITPDFSAFDSGMIQSEIDKLTAILGGAVLVLGSILTFSGANIPLGIGMMALGAAILYKEAQLNWDALSQQMHEAINGALTLAGIVALVVGLCLALSGVDIPRGIGLMAIGAMSLVAATALNWDSLGSTIYEKLSNIGVIIGGVIAVVGVFLCLTGHIPLGIAMIVAGASIFGVSIVALNWEALGATTSERLGNLMMVIGAFLGVLGVLLMLTGVAFGIGLAMLIAGASIFVAGSVAAQWNSVPNTVRDKLGLILKVVGGCLFVVGLVLLLTGIGAPIGVAMMIAGAATFGVSAAVLNWNFIKEKVAKIWMDVKSYWNTNIAKFFTISYWKNKASDIISGLTAGIKAGASKIKNAIVDTVSGAWNKVTSVFTGSRGGGFSTAQVSSAQVSSARITTADVPALARGAVIPPNREFMAVLGDQRRGYNIEAPEDLIRKIVREESGGMNTELLQAILEAIKSGKVMVMDKRTVARIVAKELNDMTREAGKPVLLY